MLSESENPPIIWPSESSVTDFSGKWWVAHTKSRNEKALAHDMINREISYFLPMAWSVRRKSRRTIKSLLPLFGGYIFFCGDENQRIQLLKTDRVANLIEVKNQQQLIDELAQIERVLKTGEPVTPHKYLKTGQKCRVVAGPLLGIQGIIVSVKGQTRLVLQVDILGQAASVEIEIDMIEPVE
ncbi:MAG: UpxY family transcription antiterminator [Sedimentisphaerales bacterium]|nr:UpxY family transcription antiterminator [Sedimentisphaerales bacterium]